MAEIEIPREQKEILAERLRTYLDAELDLEVGRFDAEFLVDFLVQEMGPVFYNRGVLDARAVLAQRVEHLQEEIEALEKPLGLER